ncbi:SDR family oxidoreductase [Qipengyuania flava]|uniref:SDR family oxidoreductase n=1 Tax=Qipengyuania flava TaxID=192812 RepID=UPI001CD5F565|nr:SDR family oxidoreductase [Qipengyuania flava]MCA0891787.1 SDR family oxidoreductase [Qipengyuania flava]
MKVFIVGITGGVGAFVSQGLLSCGHEVAGLVRDSEKKEKLAAQGIQATLGDLVKMSIEELTDAIRGSDALVFSAGAGGSGDDATTRVDGDGPGKLAKAAAIAGISRLILVSVFPEAWREREMDASFEHYMVQKKRAEVELVRTGLDWVILRPAVLADDQGSGKIDLGPARFHEKIPREDVAATIVEILKTPDVSRQILEVTGGSVVVSDAVKGASQPTIRGSD